MEKEELQKQINELKLTLGNIHNLDKKANTLIQNIFKPGVEIVFRASNMKRNAVAEVRWAKVWHGYSEIGIRNLFTGKERKINLTDVISIYGIEV